MENSKFEYLNGQENINFNILPSFINTDLDPTLDKPTTHIRLTEKQLFHNYYLKIEKAQVDYLLSLQEAQKFLVSNRVTARKADFLLGIEGEQIIDYDSSDITQLQKLKDGTIQLLCPMANCNTETFKLRRHFKTCHSSLSSDAINYVVDIARVFARNKSSKTTPTTSQTSRSNRYRNTSLVNRKENYRQCVLCAKLCRNISEHLHSVHKLDRSLPIYQTYLNDCKDIPKLYTKQEKGMTVQLEGEELRNAIEEHGNEVEEETETLEKLRKLRSNLQTLKREKENGSTDLDDQISQAQIEYKKERYKDIRKYSEKSKSWKESFEKYLKMREINNPLRDSRMAIDVILPYESHASLTFEDLMDLHTLRRVLTTFKDKTGQTSITKIKYLKMFKKMLQFLICDIDSPEYKACNTEDRIKNGMILKEAEHENRRPNNHPSK